MSDAALKSYLFVSDFDQTLTFNDSGYVLSEIVGIPTAEFERKAEGMAKLNLVQQGAELAYLLLHDPEFRAAPKIRRHFRTVDHVLARQARDVGAGAAQVLALDGSRALPRRGQMPGYPLSRFASAKHQHVVLLHVRHINLRAQFTALLMTAF